ncbi:MAG: hemolysin family protein [Candidatus Rokuibacteriota bacterium]
MRILFVLACIVASAFFSAAEMAFIAANRIRLRHLAEQGSRVARGYMKAFEQPEHLLSTAMMGVTIAHVSASAVTTALLLPLLGDAAPLWATVILTPVMLVFGEILPKALTQPRATGVALWTFDPLRLVARLLTPLVWSANVIVGGILRGLGRAERRDPFVSRDDLRLLFESEPAGSTDVREEERDMIEGIFDLGETTAREIMVPLVDVVAVPEQATIADTIARIGESGHSRLPVYRERIDHVVGIVTALDILHHGAGEATVQGLLRPIYYVPGTKRINDLLRELQRERLRLAIVVDEYGGSQGLVTVEDILEQIVGEIQDEHDRPPSTVTPLPDGSYLVAGRLGLDELNEALEWELPKKDYETVGGLILAILGRIPRPGEQVRVGEYELSVVDADERRILRVKVKHRAPEPPPSAPPGV